MPWMVPCAEFVPPKGSFQMAGTFINSVKFSPQSRINFLSLGVSVIRAHHWNQGRIKLQYDTCYLEPFLALVSLLCNSRQVSDIQKTDGG